MKNDIKLFEQSKIRSVYDEEKDLWYFSVIDVIAILIEKDHKTSQNYWNKLAERLRKEGSQSVTNCHKLKMPSSDGKQYLTAAADAETMLRIVQSVPSPKAEPIKQWLARVGYERMKETVEAVADLFKGQEAEEGLFLKQAQIDVETNTEIDNIINPENLYGEFYHLFTVSVK